MNGTDAVQEGAGRCPVNHGRSMRTELPPLPANMRDLPLDHRGYPVPWFVEWINGEPDFRIMDGRKRVEAYRKRLCWVCGKKIPGQVVAFVLGPMCALNRTTAEPGCHIECAEWSAIGCPFLTRPHMVRRDKGVPETALAPGFAIQRNPGVTLVWITKTFSAFRVPGGELIRVGPPTRILAFAEGRLATKEETAHSIATGLPSLQELAAAEGPAAVAALAEMHRAARKLLGLPDKASVKEPS